MAKPTKAELENIELKKTLAKVTLRINALETSVGSPNNSNVDVANQQLKVAKKGIVIQILAFVIPSLISIGAIVFTYKGNDNNNQGNNNIIKIEQQNAINSQTNSENTQLILRILQHLDQKDNINEVKKTKKIQ